MRNKYTLPVMAAAAVMVSPIAVHATTTVDFSFTGGSGNTVAGSLLFTSDTGSQTPTSVTITSAPSWFTPRTLKLGSERGAFTFSQGKIVNGSFSFAYRSSSTRGNTGKGIFWLPNGSMDALALSTPYHGTQLQRGFAGVAFTTVNAPTPAPEPASIALLGAGIAGLATFRRRRARA